MDSAMENLYRRSQLASGLRRFFGDRGFVEVETPMIIAANAPELHIEAMRLDGQGPGRPLYLRTSPELALKRLVASGAHRIFELARVARSGEHDDTHRTEFVLLEWYRAGAVLDDLMTDVDELLAFCAGLIGRALVSDRGGGLCRIDDGCLRMTVAEAFGRYAGIDLDAYAHGDAAGLLDAARRAGVTVPVDEAGEPGFDDVFFAIFLSRIEGRIGRDRPVILYRWPVPMAALARRDPDDGRYALRFELYAAGLELANAFDELTDPAEQRDRFERERGLRIESGLDPYPMPLDFLDDLARFPATAGIALGFERLLMLLHGLDDIGAAALPYGF